MRLPLLLAAVFSILAGCAMEAVPTPSAVPPSPSPSSPPPASPSPSSPTATAIEWGGTWWSAHGTALPGCPYFERPGEDGGCTFRALPAPFSNDAPHCSDEFPVGRSDFPEGEDLFVYTELSVPSDVERVLVEAIVDNDAWFYVDGELREATWTEPTFHSDGACNLRHARSFPVEATAGEHRFAFKVRDLGGMSYFDARITPLR